MSQSSSEIITIPPPPGSLIKSLSCPNSYYSRPNLVFPQNMPRNVLDLMSSIWNKSVHRGRNINIYSFKDVFVSHEGLVFDREARLIDCTRTYHIDADISGSIAAIGRRLDRRSIPKAVLAKSRGADNYGHFIVEMLTRAWIARTHLDLTGWPALIHESSAAIQSVSAQALLRAGYGSDEILVSGNDPVHVGEIIVVDGLTAHTQYLSPFALQCLDAIADAVPPDVAVKVYATRKPSTIRDFADEGSVAALLAGHGFSEVSAAALPFDGQIAAFKGADTVVGAMGAALTNIVFCKPGTDVFLFMPASACEVFFWMIAQARRLNYNEIRCKEIGLQLGNLPWDRSIHISPEEIVTILKEHSTRSSL